MTLTIDLSDDYEVTSRLLEDPYAWRVRAVERVEIDSGTHCLRRRSLQCSPLRPLLRGLRAVGGADEARMMLPVVAMPKGAVLDLDLFGPRGERGFLPPRGEIAAREAHFVRQLATTAGVALLPEVDALLVAALAFTEGPWQATPGRDRRQRLTRYLQQGVPDEVSAADLQSWSDLSARAGRLLAPRADSRAGVSAAEEPALVVPPLLAEGSLDVRGVTGALAAYVNMLEQTTRSGTGSSPSAVDEFVNVLADFGRFWELMAVVTVPLDEPFLIKLQERRILPIKGVRNKARQDLVISDARSNHVTLRVSDPNTRLVAVRALDPTETSVAYPSLPT